MQSSHVVLSPEITSSVLWGFYRQPDPFGFDTQKKRFLLKIVNSLLICDFVKSSLILCE